MSFGSGKIDRIDTCETEDQVYVKILDYKTGQRVLIWQLLSWPADAAGGVYGRSSPAGGKKHPGKKIVPAGDFLLSDEGSDRRERVG